MVRYIVIYKASIIFYLFLVFPHSVSAGNAIAFTEPVNYSVGVTSSYMAAGRLTNNGNYFLALTNQNSDDVLIFVGNELGNFTGPTNFTPTVGPNSLAIGDFNQVTLSLKMTICRSYIFH